MTEATARPSVRWLELVLDYKCNNRCVGCYAVNDSGPSMGTREALAAMAAGRRAGARWLWLGGGEPTLRPDLFLLVQGAKKLGYERIKLQTNGMLLADPAFAARCHAAGVTEVNFAIKGLAETHDRLTRTPGCHARMLAGMEEARRRGLGMEGDILVYRENAAEIPSMIRDSFARGVARFNLWLFSTVDQGALDLSAHVPRMSEVVPFIAQAMDLGLSDRPDFITSLHTPPCVLPEDRHAALFFPPDLGLLVWNPGGHRFMLEESPIEGGTYLPGCGRCRHRPRCGGLRREYLRIHGEDEFSPVA